MNQASRLTRARALEIASLDRSSTRRKLGQFRIEGVRAVESAVRANAPLVEIVIKHELIDDDSLNFLRELKCEVHRVDTRTASKLSSVVQDQGIVAVARISGPDPNWTAQASRVVVLDGVQDPGNVGTIVRCAAWFGFDAVVGGPGTADFFNPKTVRSMAGSMWDLDLVPSIDLNETIRGLAVSGLHTVAADLHGKPMSEWHIPDKLALLLGSEAHGLSPDIGKHVDTMVRIEGGNGSNLGVESLNVAVAAGIIMYRIASLIR
jgi:TrmH family RNA methyltransferase